MKKDRRAFEELSAYVDGEARSPRRIAERLARDPEYAREHAALQRLAACVRALPAPETRPGFEARVLAAIQAEPARPKRIPFAWKPALACAAAVAVVIGVVFYAWTPEEAPAMDTPALPLVANTKWESDEAVVAALEQLAAAGDDLSFFAPLPDPAAPQDDAVTTAVLDLLLAAAWDVDALSPYADAHDVDALIESLDPGEAGILQELTDNFTKGGWTS